MMHSQYVFIESRDPFDSPDTGFVAATAADLRARGRTVTVFLVQNGVLATRAGARGSHLPQLTGAGVRVLADDFSLAERGIDPGDLASGVRAGVDRDAGRPGGAAGHENPLALRRTDSMADRTADLAIMDAPYEAAASTTAFRIIAAALGAASTSTSSPTRARSALTQKDQAPHANPVKGTTVEQEEHPTTKDLVAALSMEPRLSAG